METATTKSDLMDLILDYFDSHTRLYHKVLEGISDKDSQDRLGTKANHVAWIAGSLVFWRYVMSNVLGVPSQSRTGTLFENMQGVQDHANYPSLAEFKADWDIIAPILKNALMNLTEDQLNGPDPFKIPGGSYTMFDAL